MPRVAWGFYGTGSYNPTDPNAAAYVAGIRATGSEVDDATVDALDTLVIGMKAGTLWGKRLRLNPMVGSLLAGVGVVLDDTVGSASDSLNNYVEGDWNPATGLQGNNTSTWMGTGWIVDYVSTPNLFLGVNYIGAQPAATKYVMGMTDNDQSSAITLASTTSPLVIGKIAGATSQINAAVVLSSGIWSVLRDSTTNLVLYKNNVSQGTNATPVGTITPTTQELVLGARNNTGGTKSNWLGVNERIAGYMFFSALDAGERTSLQSLWAAFNTAIGR